MNKEEQQELLLKQLETQFDHIYSNFEEIIEQQTNERVDEAIKNTICQLFGEDNVEDVIIKRDENDVADIQIVFIENKYTALVVDLIDKKGE